MVKMKTTSQIYLLLIKSKTTEKIIKIKEIRHFEPQAGIVFTGAPPQTLPLRPAIAQALATASASG
jgi:hypothetical protein